MLSGHAHSFRQKSKLAIGLSWVGGYTNVVTLLTCGSVSSHVTGPATWLGRVIVEGDGVAGVGFFCGVIAAFWLGAVTSALVIEAAESRGSRRAFVLPVALEAIFLSFIAIGISRKGPGEFATGPRVFAMVGTACFAMGLQNATITHISGAVVRTTHVTGVVTDSGIELVRLLFGYRKARRGAAQRLALLAGIFGSFLFGAIAGTFACRHAMRQALLLPALFLVVLVVRSLKKAGRTAPP